MNLIDVERKIGEIIFPKDLRKILPEIQIFVSNNRSKEKVINLTMKLISKAQEFEDTELLVVLKGLLILQLENNLNNLNIISEILEEMRYLALTANYKEGLAFSYSFSWYIERTKGNIKIAREDILKSFQLIFEVKNPDPYILNFIKYSYAVQNWLDFRDVKIAETFEDCFEYFLEQEMHHSIAMSLGILLIIYQQTQNKEQTMYLTKKILGKGDFIRNIPEENRSIIHFFIGFSQELSFNLNMAEEHLNETIGILRPIYKTSIYSSYYITALSYLTATYALQGKLELAYNQMITMDGLIEEGLVTRNLDDFNKKQMKHIFDLTKFYIYSRLQSFESQNLKELKQTILDNIGKYYSNSIFFSEFLLSAELTKEQLIEIRDLKTPSTKRVEHFINFLIEKAINTDEQAILNSISELKRRTAKERMTYEERAFADLLAAQEYYKLRRFSEIYPLLKKYKDNLNRIEVLELRIFMEAFIQIGAFKNGDPMGPALQYVAIRKCQQNNFSRLESKLLNYLELQRNDVVKTLFK